MRISIKDLSEKTGYSIATISNVLNGKPGVNSETVRDIINLARSSGYIQQKKIKKIRLVLYKKTGKILDDTPFFSTLYKGIETACNEYDLKLEISTLDRRLDDFDSKLDEILRDATAGFLVLATEMTEEDIGKFENCIAPVVILDNRFEKSDFPSVSTENMLSAAKIVRCFHEKGYDRIGFIQSSVKIDNFVEREKGYRMALSELGLENQAEYKIELSPTMEESYEDMKKYLASGGKLSNAYFVVNDMIAFGAMKAISEAGYKIPGDVSLIGFDDLPFSKVCSPALTTVHVFKEEMGKLGVDLLANKIATDLPTYLHCVLGTEMVFRDSI